LTSADKNIKVDIIIDETTTIDFVLFSEEYSINFKHYNLMIKQKAVQYIKENAISKTFTETKNEFQKFLANQIPSFK